MKFTKMHGLGNDYIYIDTFGEAYDMENKAELTRFFSDRHFGIGGDGVIFINPSDKADCEMEMYNMDGSRSEMCGNGIRCVGKYMYDNCLTDKTEISVISAGSVKKLELKTAPEKENPFTGRRYSKRPDGLAVKEVRVDMGEPVLEPEKIPVKLNITGDIITDAINMETPFCWNSPNLRDNIGIKSWASSSPSTNMYFMLSERLSNFDKSSEWHPKYSPAAILHCKVSGILAER